MWATLLRHPEKFVSVDSSMFFDPEITSSEYNWRYGDNLAWDQAEVLRLCNGDVEAHLYAHMDFDGDVRVDGDGVELIVGRRGTGLEYPFCLLELYDLACEVEAQAKEDEA
ncbi:MAG TPA: hypothetical protein VGV93_05445 [Acidimicrobiales bacterium]|nr:hypothetical protein [Acidimicrobiales bacterium]